MDVDDIMNGVQYGFAGGIVGGGGGLAWDVYNGSSSFGAALGGGGGGGTAGFAYGSGLIGTLSGPLGILVISLFVFMLVFCSLMLIQYQTK